MIFLLLLWNFITLCLDVGGFQIYSSLLNWIWILVLKTVPGTLSVITFFHSKTHVSGRHLSCILCVLFFFFFLILFFCTDFWIGSVFKFPNIFSSISCIECLLSFNFNYNFYYYMLAPFHKCFGRIIYSFLFSGPCLISWSILTLLILNSVINLTSVPLSLAYYGCGFCWFCSCHFISLWFLWLLTVCRFLADLLFGIFWHLC